MVFAKFILDYLFVFNELRFVKAAIHKEVIRRNLVAPNVGVR